MKRVVENTNSSPVFLKLVPPKQTSQSFRYQDKASKERNTREFEKRNNPPFRRKKRKELDTFSEDHHPNEEEGIWFGGIT